MKTIDAALRDVAATFRGRRARGDEHNCECHWGSAEELALLKVRDVELDPDLLRRTWQATDWKDHASVLRRILPQLTVALAGGTAEFVYDVEELGRSLARGGWQSWPGKQAAVVREFLSAWWASSLREAEPGMRVYDILTVCVEASGTLSPWLNTWEALADPVADRHLTEVVAHWVRDLLEETLPWDAWADEEQKRVELMAWVVRHAPDRLRAHGAPDDLLQRVRLLGVAGPARWEDPYWLDHPY